MQLLLLLACLASASASVVQTGAELAAYLANPSSSADGYSVELASDIILRDADYEGLSPPILLTKNVTIRGSRNRWKSIETGYSNGMIRLADRVAITFKYVVLSESVYGTRGSSAFAPMAAGATGMLLVEQGALIKRYCYPAHLAGSLSTQLQRPLQFPGSNQYEATASLPAYLLHSNSGQTVNGTSSADSGGGSRDGSLGGDGSGSGADQGRAAARRACVNDSWAPPLERCWARIGRYVDHAAETTGVVGDAVRWVPSVGGYLIHLRDVYQLCERVLEEECLSNLGPGACLLWTIKREQQLLLEQQLKQKQLGDQASETGEPSLGLAAAAGGGGSPGSGGDTSSRSGDEERKVRWQIAVGASLGGLGVLGAAAAVGAVTWEWRKRQRNNDCDLPPITAYHAAVAACKQGGSVKAPQDSGWPRDSLGSNGETLSPTSTLGGPTEDPELLDSRVPAVQLAGSPPYSGRDAAPTLEAMCDGTGLSCPSNESRTGAEAVAERSFCVGPPGSQACGATPCLEGASYGDGTEWWTGAAVSATGGVPLSVIHATGVERASHTSSADTAFVVTIVSSIPLADSLYQQSQDESPPHHQPSRCPQLEPASPPRLLEHLWVRVREPVTQPAGGGRLRSVTVVPANAGGDDDGGGSAVGSTFSDFTTGGHEGPQDVGMRVTPSSSYLGASIRTSAVEQVAPLMGTGSGGLILEPRTTTGDEIHKSAEWMLSPANGTTVVRALHSAGAGGLVGRGLEDGSQLGPLPFVIVLQGSAPPSPAASRPPHTRG